MGLEVVRLNHNLAFVAILFAHLFAFLDIAFQVILRLVLAIHSIFRTICMFLGLGYVGFPNISNFAQPQI